MVVKGICASAGMVVLHFLFNAIGYIGLVANVFAVSIPLICWYWYETRHREEDTMVDHVLEFFDFIDITDFLKR